MPSLSKPRIEELIRNVVLKRRALDLSSPMTVLLTGNPDKIAPVKGRLERVGFSVSGIVGNFGDQSSIANLPVVSNSTSLSCVPVVFAGRPSKQYFNGGDVPKDNLFWFDPPGVRHQRMGFDSAFVTQNHSELFDLYESLGDEESREVLLSIIRSRVEGDCGYYLISSFREYEHPLVLPKSGEVVFDLGAYDGDTAKQFSKLVGAEGRVISIEPSIINFKNLSKTIIEGGLNNVIPIYAAAWSSCTQLSFLDGNEASSKLTDEVNEKVPALTVDFLWNLLQLPRVDLIKLDVEGAEGEALNGAAEVIRRFHPKLQISVYHRPTDLWELKKQVQRLSKKSCRFFLGHHNYYHTETDLYCLFDP